MNELATRFSCPFCGNSSTTFVPIGVDSPIFKEIHVVGAGARLAGCASCGSSDRERLVYVYLKYKLQALSPFVGHRLSILHFAPELRLSEAIQRGEPRKYICGDQFPTNFMVGCQVLRLDICDLKLPDCNFDLLICNHVLEHVDDDSRAMREIRRVLKPRGLAILQVPFAPNLPVTLEDETIHTAAERERLFGQWDHRRIYGRDYEDRLSRNGLQLKRMKISISYPHFGLNPEEEIFVCQKNSV